MTKVSRVLAGVTAGVAVLASLTACSAAGGSNSTSSTSSEKVTLNYWLWDNTQQPAYQQCATDFEKANPNITIKITQTAWGQYWTNLSTQMASGDAPDVFTDQASYYPQFVQDNQILDIEPYVKKDKVDLSQYVPGLASVYTEGGKRYGLPKDWDTIGLVYNKADAAKAGISQQEMNNLTWNPQDGGTFEQAIQKMTVDKNGNNATSASFDKNSVKTYGFLPTLNDGSQGQNGWGDLAVENGWTYANKNPFGTKFNYDSPKLISTINWYTGLSAKGLSPKLDLQSTLSNDAVLQSGAGAMASIGDWDLTAYKGKESQYGIAPLPIGPDGRKSMIGGLSDAIYAGTKHPQQAWEWVKYLASPACANTVAATGVVYPGVAEAAQKSAQVREKQWPDTKVFIEEQQAKGGTFAMPISDHGTQMSQIVQNAIQSVALGKDTAKDALTKANQQVNALFK